MPIAETPEDPIRTAEPGRDIHSAAFVRALFDEMSLTYGWTNRIASLGFASRWRRQCIELAAARPGETVFDLMSGMGELWPRLATAIGPTGRIGGLDFSAAMCEGARKTAARLQGTVIELREEDMLRNSIPDEVADVVVSCFGLKTFTALQQAEVAFETARILRPGGRLAYVEISVPPSRFLRLPYLFYLHQVIPIIGRLFLGNPNNYRMLGRYTCDFADCGRFAAHCRTAGLEVSQTSYFFGCATGVVGTKPAGNA